MRCRRRTTLWTWSLVRVAVAFAPVVLVSCGGDSTGPDLEAVAQVSITAHGSTTVPVAGTVQLTATLLNAQGGAVSDQTVSWSSEDPSVAIVDASGLVTGVGVGEATITADGGGRTGEIQVTVFDPNPPAAPSDLSATGVSETRIELSWTANSTNEDVFRIEREALGGVQGSAEPLASFPAESVAPSTAESVAPSTAEPLAPSTAEPLAPFPVEPLASFTEVATVGAGVTTYGDSGLGPSEAYRYRVRACNANGCSAYSVPAEASTFGPVVILTSSLPRAHVGQAYTATLVAAGSDGSGFEWSVTGGGLPPGLSLDAATGEIAGTPTEAGFFEFTVRAVSGDQDGERSLSIEVSDVPPVSFANWYLPVAIIGGAYEYHIRAAGGDGASYVFTVVGGALPPGLSLDPAFGTLSGAASEPGTYFFEVEVDSGGATARRVFALTVSTVTLAGFNIAVLNAADGAPSAAFRAALDQALAKWEAAVTTNFAPFTMPGTLHTERCQGHGEKLQVDETIQDLVILLDVAPIDGPGGTVARAGPCGFVLGSPPLFRSGSLVVDSHDVANLDGGQLLGLLIHEVGHVLGIGTLWDYERSLLVGRGGDDPRFVGQAAVAAYADIGGTDDDIPVENQGGAGTRDAHWRQAVFRSEVMTSFIAPRGVPMPLSIMTIQSVADLGYAVNPDAADPYSVPSPDMAAAHAPGAGGGWIHLHDDVVVEPLLRLQPDGSVRLVYPPGAQGLPGPQGRINRSGGSP